jgi:uncharacterized membrane protein HdeD (DUF308 family)
MLHAIDAPNSTAVAARCLNLPRIARDWRHWWLLGLGGLALGGAAIALALVAPPGLVISVLGLLLAADAMLQLLHARRLPHHGGAGWRLSAAAASLAAAVSLLAAPTSDPLWAALAIEILLLVGGIARGFLAVTLAPVRGWQCLFAVAVLTVSLGVGLLLMPVGPPALLALAVGVVLLADGSWTLLTGRMARPQRGPLLRRPL